MLPQVQLTSDINWWRCLFHLLYDWNACISRA